MTVDFVVGYEDAIRLPHAPIGMQEVPAQGELVTIDGRRFRVASRDYHLNTLANEFSARVRLEEVARR